jgi:hypothetical protein
MEFVTRLNPAQLSRRVIGDSPGKISEFRERDWGVWIVGSKLICREPRCFLFSVFCSETGAAHGHQDGVAAHVHPEIRVGHVTSPRVRHTPTLDCRIGRYPPSRGCAGGCGKFAYPLFPQAPGSVSSLLPASSLRTRSRATPVRRDSPTHYKDFCQRMYWAHDTYAMSARDRTDAPAIAMSPSRANPIRNSACLARRGCLIRLTPPCGNRLGAPVPRSPRPEAYGPQRPTDLPPS